MQFAGIHTDTRHTLSAAHRNSVYVPLEARNSPPVKLASASSLAPNEGCYLRSFIQLRAARSAILADSTGGCGLDPAPLALSSHCPAAK